MSDLTCRIARLWVQAPDDLAPLDARSLERHLGGCVACSHYRLQQVRIDDMIRQSLSAAVQSTTVRARVREQIAGMQTSATSSVPAARPSTRLPRVSLPLSRLRRPLLILAPAVAVVCALVLIAPQFLPPNHNGITAGETAPWAPKRNKIGFPVTIDAAHSNHLLAGAWGQIYQSFNGAQTWNATAPLPSGLRIRDVAIDRTDSQRYVIATMNSIWISEDSGRHWTVAASNLLGAEIIFITQDPSLPATFYAGPSVLWKSVDHGHTWLPAGPGEVFSPDGIQSVAVAAHHALYTGIWNGGVARSVNGGASWTRLARGLNKKVLDVAVGTAGRVWAATAGGVYVLHDSGNRWHRRGPIKHFFTTSILDQGSYLLAGGNGGVFRSTDGGKHWRVTVDGLPLAAYVFGFIGDPNNPGTVYASLDSDGLYRSDDGGIHWRPVDAGLPITGSETVPPVVLFIRNGVIWHTDGNGTDPGNLTVDNHVTDVAVAPDGGAIAYVNTNGSFWQARVISAGGSAARTLASGTAPAPTRMLWSPDSARIALSEHRRVIVATLTACCKSWSKPSRNVLLTWSRDGSTLLFWNRVTGTVTGRSPAHGALLFARSGHFPALPVMAPDGKRVAMVANGKLFIGSWQGGLRDVAMFEAGCRATRWSGNSVRVLVACPRGVQERSSSGAIVRTANVASSAFWVPGSQRDLLFFHSGALWRWNSAHDIRKIVSDAAPATRGPRS
ncbi:MAG: hypothetical protein ACRDFX_01315 [Chloroflexota bacterium]